MRRRWRIVALLTAVSAAYWLAAWAWVRAGVAELEAQGAHELALFLHEGGLVYQATWGWVAGAPAVHAVVALIAMRKGDREALIGALASAGGHLAFALATGIFSPV